MLESYIQNTRGFLLLFCFLNVIQAAKIPSSSNSGGQTLWREGGSQPAPWKVRVPVCLFSQSGFLGNHLSSN
jgi:hypothetical protein